MKNKIKEFYDFMDDVNNNFLQPKMKQFKLRASASGKYTLDQVKEKYQMSNETENLLK